MSRACPLALLSLIAAGSAWGFEKPEASDRNLAAIIVQLETGGWSARIHAVHELEYMESQGVRGLAFATEDGDWQVRMTAVQALGPHGEESAPILKNLLRHESCPVVRLMILHNLGNLGPEGEEKKAMVDIFNASSKEVNDCQDQAGPGRALWARTKRPASPLQAPRPAAPAPVEQLDEEVVTRDRILPAAAPVRTAHPAEDLPVPTKIQRQHELDALFDIATATISRRGVVLEMSGRSKGAPESLPWPVAPIPREHEVDAPGLIMKDDGGKAAHDALPGLLLALKQNDVRTRARAADDLGHLGTRAAPAIPALMAALGDRSASVRSSAGLALGNIGGSHESVVPMLTDALKDRSEDVRYAAALALSRIDSPEARTAFNRHVGKEARRAIDRPQARDKGDSR